MAAAEGAPPDRHPVLSKRRSSLVEPPYMSTPLRILVFGNSGHQQFYLTESILQEAVFNAADPNTILTTKTSRSLLESKVTLVNTPNLNNHDLFHLPLKTELKKAVCFSCPGPHAVLFAISPSDESLNAYEGFKRVVQYFGEQILSNTMIVFYHEEEQVNPLEETKLKENQDIMELLEKCNQRFFIFNGKKNRGAEREEREEREERPETMKLFEEIQKIVKACGIFSNLEFKDADKRIKKEEKFLQSQRKKEISGVLEELRKKHSQEDLEKEVERYEEQVRLENRARAEVQVARRLGFTLRLVDHAAAIGKGALAGAMLSVVMGFPGTAVGAAVGAALGGLFGGTFGEMWNTVSNALADFGRDAT